MMPPKTVSHALGKHSFDPPCTDRPFRAGIFFFLSRDYAF
jgi:hypothetical protein